MAIIDAGPPSLSTAEKAAIAALTVEDILSILLVRGADLGNADAAIQPGTDKATLYVMPAATQTSNRVTTLGVTSLWTQPRVYILDLGLTEYTHTIANGGTNAYNMTVLAASRTHPWLASFFYNGVDWVPEGVLQVRP